MRNAQDAAIRRCYGIHDGLDLRDVPFKRGTGYDVAALTNVYVGSYGDGCAGAATQTAVMLFARVRADERAFWFLGPADYVTHEGERPIAITWRLRHRLPADLFTEFAAAAVADHKSIAHHKHSAYDE